MPASAATTATGPSQRNAGSSDRQGRVSDDQEIDPSDRDRGTEGARETTLHRLVEGEPDTDAEHVDHAGRQYEADRVVRGIGRTGKLNAMSIAMADREHADQDQRHRLDRPPAERDRRPQRQD